VTHFPYNTRINGSYFRRYKHGGAEVVAHKLACCMAKRGHEVHVFASSMNSRDSLEKYGGLVVHRYGTNFRIETANFALKMFYEPFLTAVDLVHAHFSTPPAELAALAYAKGRGVPLILTYHGDWQESFGSLYRRAGLAIYNKLVLRLVLSSARVIIFPSGYYLNESRFLRDFAAKSVVIPNGIDVLSAGSLLSKQQCRSRLGLPLKGKVVMFIGSLVQYKGPWVLVKAIPHIIKEVPETRVVFVGDGPLSHSLKLLSERLACAEHVRFEGFVDEARKALYYGAADVVALPSVMSTEVFPIVLLEASAFGIPVVVSDLDTFRCFVKDGYNGLVSKRGDEKDLAEKLIKVLTGQALWQAMSRNTLENVTQYSWQRVERETERLYMKVASRETSSAHLRD